MNRTVNAQTLIQAFETWAPKDYALADDREKIGLQVGTLNKTVKTVMVALDVLEDVVDEAIVKNVDLIVAHHPLIFRPLKNITTETAHGRIIEKCLKHDITVYAAHTNLDIAPGGVSDLMTEALGIENTQVLVPTYEQLLKKLVVFTPKDHEQAVRRALGDAGAGYVGNYSHCTFTGDGRGTFMPQDGTDPYIGTTGRLEEVGEVRIETIVPLHLQKQVIDSMLNAHPYEEVAYDLYHLANEGEKQGLGRIGYLKQGMTLQAFAEWVKNVFAVDGVRMVGPPDDYVKKVAVLGGDGNKMMPTAISEGADVYVTGDMYYHTAHDAWMEGLNIVDPGHNVEKIMKDGVRRFFAEFIENHHYDIKILASTCHTDPFTFV